MDLAVAILTQVVNWPLAALVSWRAATHRVPALVGGAVAVLLAAAAVAALDPRGRATFALVAVTVVQCSLVMLLAVYPDGRPVPRWIVVPAALEIALQAGNVASGFRWEQHPWWPVHFAATWGVLLVGGQLYRFVRRASVDERERVRWPLLGLVTMIFAFTLWTIAAAAGAAPFDATWIANLLLAIPAPLFAVGLLAPRILRVDRMLRLTVRWGLWAVLVATAAWLVAVATAGLPSVAGGWIAAVVTALVALPAAVGTRRLADLVVYGRRADPLRTLEELGGRLEASVDPRDVPSEIVGTVIHGLGLAGAAVHGNHLLAASAGEVPPGGGGAEFPVRYQGELLATLEVMPRRGDSQVTAHDRALLEQVCRQAAPALHGARVMGELIDARARVVHAREEERKRLRRDLHDDLAPTFAGLGLSAAAVEALTRARDDRATDAASALVSGLRSATRQLRDIAYDLRPPVLDDRGLVAALEDRVAEADAIPVVRIDAPRGPLRLPAAVELAVLRIVQEAVMNVRRHAAATECTVRLEVTDARVVVAVADDGRGLPARRREGIGLRSMRDRAEELGGTFRIARRSEGGTIVAAELPLDAGSVPPRGGATTDDAARVIA